MRHLALALALLCGCDQASPEPLPERVATVDGVVISGRTVLLRALRQYGALRPKDWAAAVARIVADEVELVLLVAEATKRGIEVNPERIDATLRGAQRRYPRHQLGRRLAALALTAAEVRQRFAQRSQADALLRAEADGQPVAAEAIAAWKAKNPLAATVRVRHLLTASESEAKEALRLYRKKGRSFAELARRLSSTPEAGRGGLLPAYAKGELPAVFDQAFSLKIGEVSAPLRSEHGWHLLRLEVRNEPGEAPDDVARRAILRTREGALQGSLIARLRAAAKVVVEPSAVAAIAGSLNAEAGH